MARFYGEIQGKAKTRATRAGTAQSGRIRYEFIRRMDQTIRTTAR